MRARILFAGVFALICLPLFLLPSDADTVESLAVADLLKEGEGTLRAGLPPEVGRLRLDWPAPAGAADLQALRVERADALRGALRLTAAELGGSGALFELPLPGRSGPQTLALRVEAEPAADTVRLVDAASGAPAAERRLGNRWSIVPPLVAILLAFLLRKTVPSLFLGVLAGALLLAAGVLEALELLFIEIIVGTVLGDYFKLYILGFVLLLSATVAVITRSGGIDGMVQSLVRFAKSSRSVQAVAYCLGLSIFFDDYANTIVVGNSAAPLFDRMKVSRARLAYIVDSTAAPVAGMAVLSTWVAYQISTYAPQLPTIGLPVEQGYAIFLETIPYRFYCWFALILVGLTIFLRRDFGPMRRAEAAARAGGEREMAGGRIEAPIVRHPRAVPRWVNGLLPLVVMVGGTAALIYFYGAAAVAAAAEEGDTRLQLLQAGGGTAYLREVLALSDSTKAIFYGSLAALVVAVVLAVSQRMITAQDAARTATRGVGLLFRNAVLILVLAWTIGEVCTRLGAANYLVSVFQDLMSPTWLPIILFLTACFVAFSTGSSWTTMAILQPNVVLLADRLGAGTEIGSHGLLVLSIGAVLEGAIFGDHCSPISDTTILSSTASGCDHIEHVRTQAPYALLGATVAIGAGYLPVALFNDSPWISIAAGAAALTGFVLLIGRRTPEALPAEAAG